MERKAFRPKKHFSQNFLYDPAIARKIVRAADLAAGQAVIELGAGKGILTRPLADVGVRLVALEIDTELSQSLEAWASDESQGGSAAVEILNADFTKVSLTALLAARELDRCVLMGNIPYHLTREVLFSFLVDEIEMLEAAYLMVQREVGERIVSPPGNRVYGIPSVILQSLYAVRILFRVSPGSFTPRPRVESVVLEFKPLAEPLIEPTDVERFSRLVRNLFQQRRKTIHNTIRSFYGVGQRELDEIERACNVDLNQRPEQLSKEAFRDLWHAVTRVTSESQ